MNKKGFTLLELIIVIIIIGVLTSLALPRLFSVIEGSRATEALSAIATIRSAMERCYLMNNGSYNNCGDFNNLGIEDPATSPNAHFGYSLWVWPSGFGIWSFRKPLDASAENVGDCIFFGSSFDSSNIQPDGSCGSITAETPGKFNWRAANIYKSFIPKSS